ncbi:MAG TPA: hypothetical protein H9716_11890 [Candidatus Enterocloster faecavium]|uniref:Uncharacterized protein n=1 Tax=Candidatus Enterocloster faecavium TaxID=2838560 RepID=A0A9D2RN48_9FIRM|nr:hypothetical protein [Candidatus Enterocloster faecavium]
MKQEAEMERYRKLLEEDSASKLLNFSEKSSIIKRSMQEAQSQQQRLIRQFGMREAEGYIKELGYRIEEEEPELMPHFLYMGIMEPKGRVIRLNRTVMKLAVSYMKSKSSCEKEQIEKFREIILFHELYHGIEEQTAGIYTRNVKVSRRLAGVFTTTRRIESASEIGAIHFSKLMAGASFSPCLYMDYLLAAIHMHSEVRDEL